MQSIKVKTILLSHFLLKIRELLSFVGRAERARFASPQPTQKLLVVLKERCELSRIGIRVQCQNVYCSIIKAALVFLRSTSTNISKGCFAMIFILKRDSIVFGFSFPKSFPKWILGGEGYQFMSFRNCFLSAVQCTFFCNC